MAGTRYTGRTSITGNYTQNSPGALGITIGGTTAATGFATAATGFDNVLVSGTTTLGGRLNVGLNGTFVPTNTNTFTVLTSTGALSGTFNNFQVVNPAGTLAGNFTGAGAIAVGTAAFNTVITTGAGGTVVLNKYTAGNTYMGSSTAWDAATASSWSVYDPGSSAAGVTPPTASGAVAQFSDGDTTVGAATVSLNSTRNVAGILFNSTNAGATNYTITQGGSGAIILDNTGNGTVATINDTSATGNTNAINVPITLNSPLATMVATGNTLTLGGALSNGTNGAQMVTKNGAGTLVLSGVNTYTGTTNVSTGTLLVNGSVGSATTPSGIVTVSNGGILGGSGMLTVTSASVNIGGILSPGTPVGTTTTGALTLNTTGGIALNGTLQIGLTSTSSTLLATNGSLVLGSSSILNVTSTTSGAASYDIVNYGGTESGTFGTLMNVPAGYTVDYGTVVTGEITLDMTPVPEPSTWVGAVLAVLGAVGVKYRRRKVQVG